MQTRLIDTSLGIRDDRRRVGRIFGEIDVREAKLMRQRLGDLLFGGEVHPYEHGAQAIPVRLCSARAICRSVSLISPA